MKVGFQLPDNGVPMIGEWDEETNTLQFDIEDHDDAQRYYPAEEYEYAVKWAMRNSINCYSEEQGNNHLDYLGVKERLGVW